MNLHQAVFKIAVYTETWKTNQSGAAPQVYSLNIKKKEEDLKYAVYKREELANNINTTQTEKALGKRQSG